MAADTRTPLGFGLLLSSQSGPAEAPSDRLRGLLEQVRLARAVGFESVWASQHLLSAPDTYFQPVPLLARLAAAAEGMTLGTAVLLLPLFHPLHVAEDMANLDVITGGRFVCGLGLGYRDAENVAMGQHPRDRVGRLREGLEILKRLWSGEAVTWEGKHFRFENVRLAMLPVQRPRPRIWLAANSDVGVKRAARLADAWLINPHTTLDTLERQMVLLHDERRTAGLPPVTDIPIGKECYLADTTAAALAESRPFLEGKYRGYATWGQDKALPAGEQIDLPYEQLGRGRFLVGDVAKTIDEIAELRERLGATAIAFRVQWPGLPQENVLRTIRLLGERVLPAVR